MKIRNISISASRPEQLQGAAASDTGASASGAAVRPSPTEQDRVEISAAARTAAGDARALEFNFARKALLGIPPLSQDRVLDLLMRIREGFYSQPETIKQYVPRLASELVSVTV